MNIKRASELTGVSSTTIRYYEKEGLVPPIDRSETGVREIDERIIRRIMFVKQMCGAGMPIEALLNYIQLFDAGEDNRKAELAILTEQAAIMEEKRDDLQAAIDHLHWKIAHFNDHMAMTEAELTALERVGRAD
ncbi:MerR family transcriptional regulator [Furfurilactobacillus entadae]|uniref:MerR family transcriptional regulator n=1 Tax=Furfurilactobacillus entadae TaxID=2922307 RepID=UPI0035E69443